MMTDEVPNWCAGCGAFGHSDEDPHDGTCRHCGRNIIQSKDGWIDPEATGDDSMWRETCDSHDTFTAEHEPKDQP